MDMEHPRNQDDEFEFDDDQGDKDEGIEIDNQENYQDDGF